MITWKMKHDVSKKVARMQGECARLDNGETCCLKIGTWRLVWLNLIDKVKQSEGQRAWGRLQAADAKHTTSGVRTVARQGCEWHGFCNRIRQRLWAGL